MRFVILHYHIFKNAGSTIEDILDHSFGERFGRLETPAEGGLVSNEDLLHYLDARPLLKAFSSHQIRYPLPQAPGYLFFDICFLRDPLDRLRSFYDYFRQRPNPADPMSDLANQSGLGDFVAGMIRDFPLFVRNNQVNLMACGGDSDEPDERDLKRAASRMRSASFLGVVDSFDRSVAAGAEALRSAFPELDCARPAVNVSGGMQGNVAGRTAALRDACHPDVYADLLRMTALDRRLVDLARADVLRRGSQQACMPSRTIANEKQSVAPDPGFLTVARRLVSLAPYWRQLGGSGRSILFDAAYYRKSADAGAGGNSHPWLHFLLKGAWQGRAPHPLFDPAFYLQKYPEVAARAVNPLCHYLKSGHAELRQPHPLFDPAFYLDRNPDVRRASVDPLLHYIRNGVAEDRKPHPLFDPVHYRAAHRAASSDALPPGKNPLVHFLERGPEAASPHPLFDCQAYLRAHPGIAERGLNPLVHYVRHSGDPDTSIVLAPVESADVIQLNLLDAQLIVFCLNCLNAAPAPASDDESRALHEAAKSRAVRLSLPPGSAAIVWQRDGVVDWIAEPQQLPFLRAVSMDQIRAQAGSARLPNPPDS